MKKKGTIKIVWSTLKKVVFIGVFFIVVLQIIALFYAMPFWELFQQAIALQINFSYLLGAFVALWGLKVLLIEEQKPIPIYYTEEEKRLRKLNSFQNTQEGLLLEWEVNFKPNGNPYIENLALYCTKHVKPIPLQNHNCPICDGQKQKKKTKVLRTNESKVEPISGDIWLALHS